jgi:hypothetical protein
MATVIRQPGSRYWIAAFRDATGKQHRRSTGETQKTRALEVAKQFERAGKGKGNPHRVRATFADFYREHFGIELSFSNVRTYCQNWLATRKAETRPATYSRYEKTIERFLETLGDSAEKDLNEVTKSHITTFRDWCLKQYATRTANLYLKIIKMVFRSPDLTDTCGKIQQRELRLSKHENRSPADPSQSMSCARFLTLPIPNGKA